MNKNHKLKDLENLIAEQCQSRKEILAAYIFGSLAKGQATSTSDLDIAVLLDEKRETSFDFLEFKVALEQILDLEIDLVVLNQAGQVLKHQVRRDGKIAFDRHPEKRKHWEIMSRKFYQDFLHLHKIYMSRMHNSRTII